MSCSCQDCIQDVTEVEIEKSVDWLTGFTELKDAAMRFCDRVEWGEVSSTRTYQEFKTALKKMGLR